jgi:hypothetical protein
MDQLLHGGEIVVGLALLVGTVVLVALLRPPGGTQQERAIVRFPGAWIVVGLPLTVMIGTGVALIVAGMLGIR